MLSVLPLYCWSFQERVFWDCVLVQQPKPLAATLAPSIGMLVRVPAALLRTQLSDNILGKTAKDSPRGWVFASMWEARMGLKAPGFSLAQTWLLQSFGE